VAVNDEGDSLIIPYVDNLWGMGKSSLGRNYIAACRKLFRPILLFRAMENHSDDCHGVILNEFIRKIKDVMNEGLIAGSTERIEACT